MIREYTMSYGSPPAADMSWWLLCTLVVSTGAKEARALWLQTQAATLAVASLGGDKEGTLLKARKSIQRAAYGEAPEETEPEYVPLLNREAPEE